MWFREVKIDLTKMAVTKDSDNKSSGSKVYKRRERNWQKTKDSTEMKESEKMKKYWQKVKAGKTKLNTVKHGPKMA